MLRYDRTKCNLVAELGGNINKLMTIIVIQISEFMLISRWESR